MLLYIKFWNISVSTIPLECSLRAQPSIFSI